MTTKTIISAATSPVGDDNVGSSANNALTVTAFDDWIEPLVEPLYSMARPAMTCSTAAPGNDVIMDGTGTDMMTVRADIATFVFTSVN
jgi:hypothetical protein